MNITHSNGDKNIEIVERVSCTTRDIERWKREARAKAKAEFLELIVELTEDLSGLGRDIVNADELIQRLGEMS